ncbi:autotransporter domain-containing protein [Starkeya koreensis]|uniref:Autotransporter domain-containing protein n=1 Tax=Ancylobacter koreensis TaxID=266121 RepID=A0ABT0DR60_9HYPH|nr:autotransporter domain-containing protein [Ancylobacter koreensis]MCK0209767.1 autotransporter domain-containing protein [Ancylobacter koreensis]
MPPTEPTTYQTLDFGENDTFLTGIRGENIVGNYKIPGVGETGGLYYNMTTQTWSPMPVTTPNGANYPGAVGSSPYGPNFGNPGGVIRVVGSYKVEGSDYDTGYLYDAAAAPGEQLVELKFPDPSPETPTLFTIAHSTFGNQAVGNYDTQLDTGHGFIYNIKEGTYDTYKAPGAVSTTIYGVYGDKIAGGYYEAEMGGGIGPEHGYVYDQLTETFWNYDHPGAVATHFEGITGAGRGGQYNLVVNWIDADGNVHPAVLHINELGHGTWYEIDIPQENVSANSMYGDKVVGVYTDAEGVHGYLATMPGLYNPITNTTTLNFADANAAALDGGKGDDIVNSGTINVTGNLGIAIRGETYGVLTNSGTVNASGIAGAAVEMHGLYGTLLNAGTLYATAESDALRTGVDTEGSIIVNTGVIDGRLAANLGADKRFENSGWLGATGTGFKIVSYFGGTFVQTAAGTFAPRVMADGNDELTVTDTLRLAGTLDVDFQGTSFAKASTILRATDGIADRFRTFTTDLPALFDATLDYAPTTVTVNVAADLAGLAGNTRNQRAVGAAIDGIVNNTSADVLTSLPEALSPLYGLSESQLPGALDALSGEAYASEQSVLVGDSLYSRQAVLARLRQGGHSSDSGPTAGLAFGGPALAYAPPAKSPAPFPTKAAPAPEPSFAGTVWAQGFGGWSNYDDGAGTASVDATLGGIISGVDVKVADWLVGAALGYSRSNTDADALDSSSEVNSLILGLYAGTSAGPWGLRLGATYAFNQIETDRTIAYPGYAEKASADYDGGTAQAFVELGYSVAVQKVAFEPFAGLAYIYVDTDGFTETGASAGLTGSANSMGVGYSSLGLRMATTMDLANGMALQPHASVAWQYAFGDVAPEAQMAFLSAPGANFTVAGVPLAQNTALVEIGSDLRLSEQASVGLSYVGQFSDNVTVNALQANLTWRF